MDEQEENEVIASVEDGEWKSVADFAAIKKKLAQAASKTAPSLKTSQVSQTCEV